MNHGWEQKCWGLTRCIFANEHHSLHELMVVAGFQCSKHRHRERANSFYVDSGRIQVALFNSSGLHFKTHSLGPGQTLEVPSGLTHRFKVIESGRVFETYWPDRGGVVRLDDIERFDTGGPING